MQSEYSHQNVSISENSFPSENLDFNYRLFFEYSEDLLCIAGFDGYFKKINPALSRVLGYSLEELYSKPINSFVFKDDQDITNRVRSDLHKSIPLYHFENRYQTKSGDIVWLSWTSVPIEDQQLVFAIAKDITQKKKIELEQTEVIEKLTKFNQELKRLTLMTSHDLRSPVSNLLTIFNLIDTSKISDKETLELISLLKQSSEELKDTLNHYVDLFKIKHTEDFALEEVSFATVLGKVKNTLEGMLNEHHVKIISDFHLAESIPFNPTYLFSIFLNLVTNSVKYCRSNKSPIIEITSCIKGNLVEVVYKDNGKGFNTSVLQKENWVKAAKSDDSKGVGLFLIQSQIKAFGGHIHIQSKKQKGSTFTLLFQLNVPTIIQKGISS
ncbi:sensor histidine kinase [Zhouia sp. PK063]|uniref:sensor histidine kinase n=1 Tax=Zhouia sp. PK063 TaxID=3373602 RepID=UPI0037B105B6